MFFLNYMILPKSVSGDMKDSQSSMLELSLMKAQVYQNASTSNAENKKKGSEATFPEAALTHRAPVKKPS